MRLQVKGKNVEISDSIRSYAEQKLRKLADCGLTRQDRSFADAPWLHSPGRQRRRRIP